MQEIREIDGVAGVHVMAYRQEEAIAEIIDASEVLGRAPSLAARRRVAVGKESRSMTDTVISSLRREVVIGFDSPLRGDRASASTPPGARCLRRRWRQATSAGWESDALAQVAAGAHMLDVNAGIPLADEPAILARAVQLVQSITDVPLSIDSSIVAALQRGLEVYQGKALVNSVTGEEERLESVLPLVRKHGAAVVAISNDETGISEDPDVRFAVARKNRGTCRGPRHSARRRGGGFRWSCR